MHSCLNKIHFSKFYTLKKYNNDCKFLGIEKSSISFASAFVCFDSHQRTYTFGYMKLRILIIKLFQLQYKGW